MTPMRVRRPITPPEQIPLIAETAPTGGVERKRRATLPPSKMKTIADEVEEFVKHDRWETARPIHFVALYLRMHLSVYGVEALDCGPAERLHAAGAAGKMLDREFDGDPLRMVDFMRWAWKRESDAERWRRENHRDGRHISWRLQWSTKLLVDYKISNARTGR